MGSYICEGSGLYVPRKGDLPNGGHCVQIITWVRSEEGREGYLRAEILDQRRSAVTFEGRRLGKLHITLKKLSTHFRPVPIGEVQSVRV
jgi:hypothetical protein